MKRKIGFQSVLDKPPGYYRSNLTLNCLRLAMEGKGWLSITQLTARLADKIPPEASARWYELHNPKSKHRLSEIPLEVRMARGIRTMLIARLHHLVKRTKRIEKHGTGKEARYRWIEEDTPAEKDSAGRGHAVKKRTRPKRD